MPENFLEESGTGAAVGAFAGAAAGAGAAAAGFAEAVWLQALAGQSGAVLFHAMIENMTKPKMTKR